MKGFMIAGTSSGCGKSTVAMGLNRLLYRKGYSLQPWKCGPDYIDPGFHTLAAHSCCRNLDTRLMDSESLFSLFMHHSHDAEVCPVEGVMGYYDGEAGRYDKGSSYDLSKELNLPVFIVIDVGAAAQSAAATALGFLHYRKDAPIAGFILNRAGSKRHESMVRDAVEAATGKAVVGVIPKRPEIKLPSRHLGLKMASEEGYAEQLELTLETLADLMEESLDLEKILSLSTLDYSKRNVSEQIYLKGSSKEKNNPDGLPIIAVARDDAFSFYYQDNLDLLEDRGASLRFFSPLKDQSLPHNCSALYFGGGYPERFAEVLSGNETLINEIRSAAEDGMPIYGECGGYMYLAESLKTMEGERWPMCGLLPGKVSMSHGLKALGYGSVRWMKDTFLAAEGTIVPGHLFHWSSLEEDLEQETLFSMDKRGEILNEGYEYKNVIASYVHFHFASHRALADNFVSAAHAFEKSNEKRKQ
jgi:cobyrinic acid a,c-diamide synthase